MRKILCKVCLFIFLLFFYFSLQSPAYAFPSLIKYKDNPLHIEYIDDYSSSLQTYIFKDNNLYKGIFAIKKDSDSNFSLGYFESSNGFNWEMKKSVLRLNEDIYSPSLLKTKDGKEYLLH